MDAARSVQKINSDLLIVTALGSHYLPIDISHANTHERLAVQYSDTFAKGSHLGATTLVERYAESRSSACWRCGDRVPQ